MRTRAALLAVLVVVLFVLAGCQVTEIEEVATPDPAAIPSGSAVAEGAVATGPIVELGSGVIQGIGWRYLAFPSDDGWCTQLEAAAVTETACGGLVPDEGRGFGDVSQTGRVIHGIATPEAATVWLVVNSTPSVPAFLMPLDEAGLDGGVVFVGIPPSGTEVSHVMAVKFNGDVLETYELP